MRRPLVLVVVLLAALLAPAPVAAVAAPVVNPWRVVSERSGANLDEASSVRASNGVLHVVYHEETGTSDGLRYRTLSAAGAWSAPEAIASGWASINNADIELVGGAPHVFWGGQRSVDVSDPASSGQGWYASRAASGTWTLSAAPFTSLSTAYASSELSTALATDGTPWATWTGTFGLRVHTGLATGANEPSLSKHCCDYASNVGRDAKTGDIFAVYYSNADTGKGYFTQRVSPTTGDRVLLAGGRYANNALSRIKRLAAASRTAGGVYSAYCDRYPSCTSIRVAAVTGPSLRLALPSAANAETVWTAAAPLGRMWVSWADAKGVWVARSNMALTKWGAYQPLKGPRNFDTVWSTGGEASRGPLDLFANVTVKGDTRMWHQRVKPKLAVTAPAMTHSDMTRTISLRLVDAGDPVIGTIRFGGVTKATNALGYATFTIPRGTRTGSYPAVGSARGYVAGSGTVRVHNM